MGEQPRTLPSLSMWCDGMTEMKKERLDRAALNIGWFDRLMIIEKTQGNDNG